MCGPDSPDLGFYSSTAPRTASGVGKKKTCGSHRFTIRTVTPSLTSAGNPRSTELLPVGSCHRQRIWNLGYAMPLLPLWKQQRFRAMRCRLVFLLCCFLSRESAGFVPGRGAVSFLGRRTASIRNSGYDHAHKGLRHMWARPAMTMEAEVAGQETRSDVDSRKKVVVIGAGWAGLAAAYELSKQVNAR